MDENKNLNNNQETNGDSLRPSFLNTSTTTKPSNTEQTQSINPDPVAAVSNLDREEVMEEALSHTTQYTPFEVSKTEFNPTSKGDDNKKAIIFIVIIFVIMFLFILFLPQISKMFGWK